MSGRGTGTYWSCDACLKLVDFCQCYDDRADRIEHKAQRLVDDATTTEDGQSMLIDPGLWRDLRHALNAPPANPREPTIEELEAQLRDIGVRLIEKRLGLVRT